MTKKTKVNMISESEFFAKGHGVHTAYIEMTNSLTSRSDIDLVTNSNRLADIVHIHTVGFYALRKLLSKNGKKVVSAHLVPDSFVGSLALAKYWKPLSKSWLKFFYGKADLVLACSKATADELKSTMNLKNVAVLYNSIDIKKYKTSKSDKALARKALKIASNKFVIVSSGQIQPRKRFDIFIKMAQVCPDYQFIWVGGMPFKRLSADYHDMKKMVESAPPNLLITGIISLDEVKQYYQAADVFVFPSTQETFGLSVVEAAATGLPIVLRDIPDYDYTFKDGALLVKNDDDFAKTIKKMASDKAYLDSIKKRSALIAERFNSEQAAQKLIDFYKNLLAK